MKEVSLKVQNSPKRASGSSSSAKGNPAPDSTPGSSETSLVFRDYVEETRFGAKQELSIRIEHKDQAFYFPLGSADPAAAALRADEIQRMVIGEGWASVCGRYPREITLAVFWTRNPLCCTYFSLYSVPDQIPARWLKQKPPANGVCRTVVVHPDDSVRRAARFWVNRQQGFFCEDDFAALDEALASVAIHKSKLMLVDRSLMEKSGSIPLDQLRLNHPTLSIFGIGIYEESNYIFHSVTGVKEGYMLCRREAASLFDPIKILATHPALKPAELVVDIKNYFQKLLSGPDRLTSAKTQKFLTHREHDVMMGLSRGLTEKQLAESLKISTFTVHNHVKNIYAKLHVHSRTEAVMKYLHS